MKLELPAFHVFRKGCCMLASKFCSSLTCRLTSLMNEKAQFIAELRKYINTHSLYSVDEFLMLKVTLNLIIICA